MLIRGRHAGRQWNKNGTSSETVFLIKPELRRVYIIRIFHQVQWYCPNLTPCSCLRAYLSRPKGRPITCISIIILMINGEIGAYILERGVELPITAGVLTSEWGILQLVKWLVHLHIELKLPIWSASRKRSRRRDERRQTISHRCHMLEFLVSSWGFLHLHRWLWCMHTRLHHCSEE